MRPAKHTGQLTATGLTRLVLWRELSPFSVCQGFGNLSRWVSEYQRLAETKRRFRETGNNSNKESLLMRDTDLPNENHTHMYCCCYHENCHTDIFRKMYMFVLITTCNIFTYDVCRSTFQVSLCI